MEQARRELENIKTAVRQGLITPTTKGLLEEAEANIMRLEAALHAAESKSGHIAALPLQVNDYLNRLHRVSGKDSARARAILQTLVGGVTFKPNEKDLEAILQGNVPGILDLTVTARVVPGGGFRLYQTSAASLDSRKL